MTGPAAVEAFGVVLAYGSHVAVSDSSFSIPQGGVTAIIGPNGSGKSTLLNAIAGLIQPAAGAIVLPDRPDRETRVSYVLQGTKVNESLPISVREVVMMGRYATTGLYRWISDDDRAAVDTAMERVGITHLASRHIQELSGGQRQRVFVAQGLAQDHSILLLDEPLTGIDLPTAQSIDKVIHDETNRGCTVVLTTHDLSEAQVADHVVMVSGRVIAHGKPDDVLTQDNLVDAYGPSLLHIDEGGAMFLDDPAHTHLPGRHVHRERRLSE